MIELQRMVSVTDFGPVKYAEIDLSNNFQVYVGAQASGKSTLCKVCYFCRKIRDYTLTFMLNRNQFEESHENEYFNNYLKFLTRQFMGCFGTTKHMKPFRITYRFGKCSIDICLQKGYVKFLFDEKTKKSLLNLIDIAATVYAEKFPKEASEIIGFANFISIVKQSFVRRLQQIFADNQDIIYVPAGRSLLATIPEKLQGMPIDIIDLTMQEFIHRISEIKDRFAVKLPEMRENYLKTVKGQINNAAVDKAYTLIRKIMKADYTSESDGEKIYFDEKHWVKLMYSSSGQQEALWILLICYLQILEKRSTFMIVEEPEAHLFPDAQQEIIKLLSLMVNTTSSNILLTTHSPYILTSSNILLFASSIKKESVDTLIDRQLRICGDFFAADRVENGKLKSIFDVESQMIDIDYIDRISGDTNEVLDKLIEMSDIDDLQ